MRQDEHASPDHKSVAVATVVAAVDQARSRVPSEAPVFGEQVERHCLLTSLLTPHLSFFHVFFFLFFFITLISLCVDLLLPPRG